MRNLIKIILIFCLYGSKLAEDCCVEVYKNVAAFYMNTLTQGYGFKYGDICEGHDTLLYDCIEKDGYFIAKNNANTNIILFVENSDNEQAWKNLSNNIKPWTKLFEKIIAKSNRLKPSRFKSALNFQKRIENLDDLNNVCKNVLDIKDTVPTMDQLRIELIEAQLKQMKYTKI